MWIILKVREELPELCRRIARKKLCGLASLVHIALVRVHSEVCDGRPVLAAYPWAALFVTTATTF